MNPQPLLHNPERVLVVGTTSDYVDWIRNARPGQALFITEPAIREKAGEPRPGPDEEILCPITDTAAAQKALERHAGTWGIRIIGVACFDCESMETASLLAMGLGVPFPDLEAIRNSRDKFVSKQLWQASGIACPAAVPVMDKASVLSFLEQARSGIVLKPFCGSGSELIFSCRTQGECEEAFETITSGLAARNRNPLFRRHRNTPHLMVAEERVAGPEYSCDFVLENDRAVILRKTRKIKMHNRPFGTISGYALCRDSDAEIKVLADLFYRAARVLGIHTGICMVDFILRDGTPVIIEMTPRPGGDCLPFLLREAGNIDILGLTLDVARGKFLGEHLAIQYKSQIGFRIHARKNGILKRIRTDGLANDKRLKGLHLIRTPGHVVAMPPEDYDSWLLGHVILEPENLTYPETECLLMTNRIEIEMDETC